MQPFPVAEDNTRGFGVEHGGAEPVHGFAEVVAIEIDQALVALRGRVQEVCEVSRNISPCRAM